ncbi:MAG: NADH-quinone oxidoreductase subunit H [Methanobacteriaceae archaeon]|jgi:energy-converting hydrogenase A subunit J
MNLMVDILLNVLAAFLVGSMLLGLQRKVVARIQMRPGPPVTQYLLHILKFYIKESSFPKTAAMPFYIGIAIILMLIWVTAVIAGPVTQGPLLITFSVYAIHKIVEHNAGSSSGSPYGKLSCVRAVMSAAGELPLFAVFVIIFYRTGTVAIADIINYQAINGSLLLTAPLAAFMYLILILSKAQYAPFAVTESKDIISGYKTEHFGSLRGYFMIADSIMWYMLLWSFLAIFLGPMNPILYIIAMVGITVGIAFISATTPVLNPNHSVALQIIVAVTGITGSILFI